MEAVVSNSTLVYTALSAVIWLVYGILALGPIRLRGGGPRGNRDQHRQMLYFAGALAAQSALFMSLPMMGRLRGAGSSKVSLGQAPNRPKEFILELQWTPGICFNGRDYQKRKCSNCYRDHWTIHGLWSLEYFCEVYEYFYKSALYSLDLTREFWPSCLKPEDEFWSFQWWKHGVCFRKFNETNSVRKYFLKAIRLAQDANVRGVLAAKDIVPSTKNKVSYFKVKEALEEAFGSSVIVDCDIERYGKSLLTVVRICYDNQFRYTNCPKEDTRCYDDVSYVEYPGSNKKPSHKEQSNPELPQSNQSLPG